MRLIHRRIRIEWNGMEGACLEIHIEHKEYQRFLCDPATKLLWIKGDPGKGKTILICGVIDDLQEAKKHTLSYFFYRRADSHLNNASSGLRGLIFLLVSEQPALIRHVQSKHNERGIKLFEGSNAWITLLQIFIGMTQSPELKNVILIVDALDECTIGRSDLLTMIIDSVYRASNSIRWVISSRNWPDIEEKLNSAKPKVRLQLELNRDLVFGAILSYIKHKVRELAIVKNYNSETKLEIESYLTEHADGTFLWVALVC